MEATGPLGIEYSSPIWSEQYSFYIANTLVMQVCTDKIVPMSTDEMKNQTVDKFELKVVISIWLKQT